VLACFRDLAALVLDIVEQPHVAPADDGHAVLSVYAREKLVAVRAILRDEREEAVLDLCSTCWCQAAGDRR
jgi:hypothetical protein